MKHINTLPDAIQLLKQSSNIVLLIGAGISVSCGIPDFRSEDGIYNVRNLMEMRETHLSMQF